MEFRLAKKNRIPHKFLPWIEARKKYRLSDSQIQMARELGLSPKRFSSYADRKQQPWKLPLTEFIEALYEKRFHKFCPDEVKSMEQLAAEHVAKRAAKKASNETEGTEGEASETESLEPESSKPESPEPETSETEPQEEAEEES